METVLLITPYFPPMGVVGSKRPLHLCRHLPALGWKPVVLAAPARSEHCIRGYESTIPDETSIHRDYVSFAGRHLRRDRALLDPDAVRASAAESSNHSLLRTLQYISPFDRYLWDRWGATRAARRLVKEEDVQVVHTIAGPFSALFVGEALSREHGLPWIIDFRDPWSLQQVKMDMRPRLSQRLVCRYEERFFRQASRIILNSEAALQAHRELYAGRIPPERFTCIRNAHDTSLLNGSPRPVAEAFTLAYFGKFRHTIGPETLLDGFRYFLTEARLKPEEARLRIFGAPRQEDLDAIATRDLREHVDLMGDVPLPDSLEALSEAHALTLIAFADRPLQIPAKLYDYLAVGRPILALSESEEVNRIVNGTEHGVSVNPHDAEAIAQAMARIRKAPVVEPPVSDQRYSAATQARLMRDVYEEALA